MLCNGFPLVFRRSSTPRLPIDSKLGDDPMGEKKGNQCMWKYSKPWIIGVLKQLFEISNKREGKFRLTRFAVNKMHEYTLSEKDIADVFLYGEQVKEDMIVRKYPSCQIGIIVKKDEAKEEAVIVTCWKR